MQGEENTKIKEGNAPAVDASRQSTVSHFSLSLSHTHTQYSGIFILGMRLAHYTVQKKCTNVEVKKAMTLAAGAVWGACGVLTAATWKDGKEPNLFVNFGLQVFFTAAYAHQYLTMGSKKD